MTLEASRLLQHSDSTAFEPTASRFSDDFRPQLDRVVDGHGVAFWTDHRLRRVGVLVAFSERNGGASPEPYSGCNLAAHVGDQPNTVDDNRSAFLVALGLQGFRDKLTCADQVHGVDTSLIDTRGSGQGAFATGGRSSVPAADALLTVEPGLPLMLCFADCVPVVLVAPRPAVAVVHAGWRGVLGRLPRKSAEELCELAECESCDLVAYIGAHIRACHYEVDEELLSQFTHAFGTVARAQNGGLDLEAVVRQDLTDLGVPQCRITSLGACTAEETDRFFSYRAEQGNTGRHAALGCILPRF